MTYLTIDPLARVQYNGKPDPRELLANLSQQGLLLNSVGYVGARRPVEARKLKILHFKNNWVLTNGTEIFGQFGNQESRAREALRLLQDTQVTEMVHVGLTGFPLFLNQGQAPRLPLGYISFQIHPAQVKAQIIQGIWFITDGNRTIFELGQNRADAELLTKIIQHYQFDQLVMIGDPSSSPFRMLARSR